MLCVMYFIVFEVMFQTARLRQPVHDRKCQCNSQKVVQVMRWTPFEQTFISVTSTKTRV